jgi:cold shock protein
LQRHIAISNFFFNFYMNKGTVKFFNETKGFGFIVDNSTSEEIFVHVTGLIDNIREGDVVTYNTARGKKGMNAVDVKIA